MSRLVWAFGTKVKYAAILLTLGVTLTQCTSEEPKQPEEPAFSELDNDEILDDDLVNFSTDLEPSQEIQILHPKDDKPWTLKTMVMTANKPPEEDLIKCRSELFAIAKETTGETGMQVALQKVMVDVSKERKRYHWCFYFSMMTLNNKLESDALGKTLRQRLDSFHTEIKILWIMARALDQAFQTGKYFRYARGRYMKVSSEHFARQLNPHDRPDSMETPMLRRAAEEFE